MASLGLRSTHKAQIKLDLGLHASPLCALNAKVTVAPRPKALFFLEFAF